MFRNIKKKFFSKKYTSFIHADEVLMDSQNIPGFNIDKLEGVIERPIPVSIFTWLKITIIMIMLIFIIRMFFLQIIHGVSYRNRADNNRFDGEVVFANRGIIYDRNLIALAWNQEQITNDPKTFIRRNYINEGGFSHVLGYVKYPETDSSGNLWRTETTGEAGIEKVLNETLSGHNGVHYVEKDVTGNVMSKNTAEIPIDGENIVLSIDSRIQSKFFEIIAEQANNLGFVAGAGAIMDVTTGELVALTSFPEYDSNIMSEAVDKAKITEYKLSSRKPFINRAVSGLYTPGSIVKPFIALAGLQEGLITKNTTVYSSGKITIPNKYDPAKPQSFRDWKTGGHGTTNLDKAIAESVNTYFYALGGGYGTQSGLGIDKIHNYMTKFGVADQVPFILPGNKKGTVPSKEWKQKKFKDGTWRLGDTYNTSIGQFGFQTGILQMLRALSAITNNGEMVDPVLVHNAMTRRTKILDIDVYNYEIVRHSMRTMVQNGTGKVMDVPFVEVAGKSGTAQVGPNRRYMNSWITGFFPYDKPKYAFVVVLEQGPSTNQTGASHIMAKLFYWMNTYTPEYFGKEKINQEKETRIPVLQTRQTEELSTTIDTLDQFYESYNILEEEPEKTTQKKQKPEEPTISEAADVLLDGTAPLESTDNQSL